MPLKFTMGRESRARKILEGFLETVRENGEGGFYVDQERALIELERILAKPTIAESRDEVILLLAPTNNLQELSMETDWGDEFNKLAAELERILG